MKKSDYLEQFNSSSPKENEIREQMLENLLKTPIPRDQILENLALFLNTKNLSRLLFINDMYKKILEVQGVIIEFGIRWGPTLSLLSALRGLYEPYNIQRKIIGFDTFEGFIKVTSEDGNHEMMTQKNLSVTDDYQAHLENILSLQEQDNPVSHIKKFELRKGNAPEELKKYLLEHPETVISMVIMDMDLYAPTKECLKIIKPYLVKGSLMIFDEVNCETSPGETVALRETLGLNNIRLKRPRYATRVSYCVLQ